MMTHGADALGGRPLQQRRLPHQAPDFGESYSHDGAAAAGLQTVPPPTVEETVKKGVLACASIPLPRFEISQPGNILRVFERGRARPPEIGIPDPRTRRRASRPTGLSHRGLGTQNRTDPVFLGLQKTRLLDPTLQLPRHQRPPRRLPLQRLHGLPRRLRQRPLAGRTPGRTPSSATAALHAVRRPDDPARTSRATRSSTASRSAIPTSQCMVCHIHPGTTVMNSYLGYMWWDKETDGELMYPQGARSSRRRAGRRHRARQPRRAAALSGLWSDPKFLDERDRS